MARRCAFPSDPWFRFFRLARRASAVWMKHSSRLSISVASRQRGKSRRMSSRNFSRETCTISESASVIAVRRYGLRVNVEGKPSTEPARNTLFKCGSPSTSRATLPLYTRKTPLLVSSALNRVCLGGVGFATPIARRRSHSAADPAKVFEIFPTLCIAHLCHYSCCFSVT